MSTIHWSAPDIPGDILTEAWRPGAAAPVAIHLRPELHDRLRAECSGVLAALPVVVDDGIPVAPGFEIHRAVPPRAAPPIG